MSLRLSELYTSIQCEGPNTGYPTQFVRFAGCNLRCPGWPCDTQHAIDPAIWKTQSEKLTAEQLFNILPRWPKRLCLTGGEPFLQPNVELHEFVEMCIAAGYYIECFTNGTFTFPQWALQTMSFMMDWKLPGSGESDRLNDETRLNNANRLRRSDGIKFVCVDIDDMVTARQVSYTLLEHDVVAQLWAAPAWDRLEPTTLIDYIQETEVPWRLNLQVHKMIWHPDERLV